MYEWNVYVEFIKIILSFFSGYWPLTLRLSSTRIHTVPCANTFVRNVNVEYWEKNEIKDTYFNT